MVEQNQEIVEVEQNQEIVEVEQSQEIVEMEQSHEIVEVEPPVLVALAMTVGYKANQEEAVCFENLMKMAVLVE